MDSDILKSAPFTIVGTLIIIGIIVAIADGIYKAGKFTIGILRRRQI